jgi:hypothetical protein
MPSRMRSTMPRARLTPGSIRGSGHDQGQPLWVVLNEENRAKNTPYWLTKIRVAVKPNIKEKPRFCNLMY